jgi:hypothetical protein
MYIGLNNLGLNSRKAGEFEFSPAQLFTNGIKGFWYNFNDPTSLFSDTAGTTPAEIDGTVAYIKDLSGNGIHLTQSTDGSRAILRSDGTLYWLEFDGLDDFYRHALLPAMDTAITTQVSTIKSDTGSGAVGNVLDGGVAASAQRVLHGAAGSSAWRIFAGSTLNSASIRDTADHVMYSYFNGASSYMEIDGSSVISGNAGTSVMFGVTVGSDPVSTTTQPFKGRIYGVLAINRGLTEPEKVATVRYFGALAGL